MQLVASFASLLPVRGVCSACVGAPLQRPLPSVQLGLKFGAPIPCNPKFPAQPLVCAAQYVCWVELLVIQALAPRASMLGHLCGILAGLIHVHFLAGYLYGAGGGGGRRRQQCSWLWRRLTALRNWRRPFGGVRIWRGDLNFVLVQISQHFEFEETFEMLLPCGTRDMIGFGFFLAAHWLSESTAFRCQTDG